MTPMAKVGKGTRSEREEKREGGEARGRRSESREEKRGEARGEGQILFCDSKRPAEGPSLKAKLVVTQSALFLTWIYFWLQRYKRAGYIILYPAIIGYKTGYFFVLNSSVKMGD